MMDFSTMRLARTQDIVLIDALDPFGGGMFPLGRRREPSESLARASAIVVTRVEPGRTLRACARCCARYNRDAPIFRRASIPRYWVDYESKMHVARRGVKLGPVAAFCGLGNPRSFWKTLEELGIDVAFRWAFGDHHHYRPAELERLAKQARAAEPRPW